MERREKIFAIRHFVFFGMAEEVRSCGGDQSGAFRVAQVSIETDFSQCHNHAQIFEHHYFAVEKWSTVAQLYRCGLIKWRRAASGGGDVRVSEYHPVVAMRCRRLRGESVLMKNGI